MRSLLRIVSVAPKRHTKREPIKRRSRGTCVIIMLLPAAPPWQAMGDTCITHCYRCSYYCSIGSNAVFGVRKSTRRRPINCLQNSLANFFICCCSGTSQSEHASGNNMRLFLPILAVTYCWSTSHSFTPIFRHLSSNSKAAVNFALDASTAVDLVYRDEKPGWHRRVIRRLRRRRRTKTQAIALSTDEETQKRFFLSYFRGQQRLATTFSTTSSSLSTDTTTTISSSSLATRWLERTVERNLLERFDRWTNGSHDSLKISCSVDKFQTVIRRCELSCDAIITADRLVFPAFQCSGGSLRASQLSLNLWSFTKFCRNTPRYSQAFEFHAQDLTMTSADLLQSNCIRNGLCRLLTRILHRSQRFLSNVQVEIHQLEILESSEIACRGVAVTKLAAVPFEVRTQLGISGRGHILTFPGLELSIPGIRLRLALPDVTLDVGHNTILRDIRMQHHQLKLSAKVRITPEHTRLVQYQQRSESFGALCSVDVGQWLTRLGRFSH